MKHITMKKIKIIKAVLTLVIALLMLPVASFTVKSTFTEKYSSIIPLTDQPPRLTNIYADYDNELRESSPRDDGYYHINTPLLLSRLADASITTYAFLVCNYFTGPIRHQPTDWYDLRDEFMPAAQDAGIQVWVYLTPPSEESPPPYYDNYVTWAHEIATLSVRYPNLKGMVIDDFNNNLWKFTPSYCSQISNELHSHNSDLSFFIVDYYPQTITDLNSGDYTDSINGVIFADTHVNDPSQLSYEIEAIDDICHGGGTYHYDIPLIVMIYCYRLHGIDPTTAYIQEALTIIHDEMGSEHADGMITYCLTKEPSSDPDYLLIQSLYSEWQSAGIHEVWPGESIQEVINEASEGDTVFVHMGTYSENIEINKNNLHLIGESILMTIIDGSGLGGTGIYSQGYTGLEVSGFTLRNFYCGINLAGSHNTIRYNAIVGNNEVGSCGIAPTNAYDDNVNENFIQDMWIGMFFCYTRYSTFMENRIQNTHYGIYMVRWDEFGGDVPMPPSNNNLIYHNDFIDNAYHVYIQQTANSNSFDNRYPSGGNYWSGHTCYGDPSNGNYPKNLGFSNVDHYPFQHPNGWLNPNAQPTAIIDSISPNPAYTGQTVTFTGYGVDDGTIVQWQWRVHNDIDHYWVYIGYTPVVFYSDLPAGRYTVYLKVLDDDGVWSTEAQASLEIKSTGGKIFPCSVYPDGNGP